MNKEEKENLREIFSRKTMYGNLNCTIEISIADKDVFGDEKSHKMEFDVWDGFAYCYDYKGKEYKMIYPTTSLIGMASTMAKKVREHCQLEEKESITPVNILETYLQLSEAY